MKTLINFTLILVSTLVCIASLFWAVISFIIYLVKDIPFDFDSLWIFGISFILLIIFITIHEMMTISKEAKLIYENNEKLYKPMKSKFQEALDKMKEDRLNNK